MVAVALPSSFVRCWADQAIVRLRAPWHASAQLRYRINMLTQTIGCSLSSGSSTGSGTSGDMTLSVGSGVVGAGGSVSVTAGDVVDSVGGSTGGSVSLEARESNAADGGSSSLSAGASTLSDGGVLTLTGGSGAVNGGAVSLGGGSGSSGDGGSMTVSSGSTGDSSSGSVMMRTPAGGTTAGDSGAVSISTGSASVAGDSGAMTLKNIYDQRGIDQKMYGRTPTPAIPLSQDMSDHRKKQRIPVVPLYVPNLLGYARILLAFLGLYYALLPIFLTSQSPGPGRAVKIWILSASLDLFDGYVARKLDQCSRFGILLDILADNILRTVIWISAAMASVSAYVSGGSSLLLGGESRNEEDSALYTFPSMMVVLISCGIICLEWTTMLCTQLKSAADGKHWKVDRHESNGTAATTAAGGTRIEEPPAPSSVPPLVAAIFRNNFRTPPGMLTMYGLFSAGMWTYGSYFDQLRAKLPLFDFWWALAILGRIISIRVELWLCWSYLRIVLTNDEHSRGQDKAEKIANGSSRTTDGFALSTKMD